MGYPAVNHRSSTARGRGNTRVRPRVYENGRGAAKAYEAAVGGVGTRERSVAQLSRASAVIGVGVSDWRTVYRADVTALGVIVAP